MAKVESKYEAEAGESFYSAVYRVQGILEEANYISTILVFNGIDIMVNRLSVMDDLNVIYNLRR